VPLVIDRPNSKEQYHDYFSCSAPARKTACALCGGRHAAGAVGADDFRCIRDFDLAESRSNACLHCNLARRMGDIVAGSISNLARGAAAGAKDRGIRRRDTAVELTQGKTGAVQAVAPVQSPSPCAMALRITLGNASPASVAIGTQRMPSGARERAASFAV
jgi:hypothetical protein